MSENQPKQLTRHDMREIALRCVYQHLLLGTDIRKCVFDAMRGNNNIEIFVRVDDWNDRTRTRVH